MDNLMTITEIASMFQVGRKQVDRWKHSHAGFPRAVSRGHGATQLYRRADLIEWGVLTRRWDEEAGCVIDDWKRCPCCDKVTLFKGRSR
jgi:hypothetical protein